jgi:Cytochrome c7 and related cytochrome c/Class III cytochrome C family
MPPRSDFVSDPPDPKPQDAAPKGSALFTAGATTLLRVAIAGAALLVLASGSLAYAYYQSTYWNRVGVAPMQPILFSHRHHAAELRIDCRNCHGTVETGAFAGMPSTHTCLTCHSQIFTETSMIRPLVQSAATNLPLQWNRVNRLPSHVYFNHSIHIAKGVACITCHGEVGKMALTAKGEPLTMRWCIDCHQDPAPHLSEPSDLFEAVLTVHAAKHTPAQLAEFYRVSTGTLLNCSTCHH